MKIGKNIIKKLISASQGARLNWKVCNFKPLFDNFDFSDTPW